MIQLPYRNFLRLQLLLGVDYDQILGAVSDLGVPAPSLKDLAILEEQLLLNVPTELQPGGRFTEDFLPNNLPKLRKFLWTDLPLVVTYVEQQPDFAKAFQYFREPDLRVRMNCLILAKHSDPTDIANILTGWTKALLEPSAVEVYSYYFCNMDDMGGMPAWKNYVREVKNYDHRTFLAQAFDVQSNGDLVVLMSDLNVRSAVDLNSETAIEEIMKTAYIFLRKEQDKIQAGVPAKNTAVFEWSDVFCKMFDRARAVAQEQPPEGAVDNIQTNLVRIRQRAKRLEEYVMAEAPTE